MRLKKIFSTGGISIISIILCLFLVNGVAQAQCVPGTAVDYGDKGGVIYLSSSTNRTPKSLWTPCVQIGYLSSYSYADVWIVPFLGCYGYGWMSNYDMTGECVGTNPTFNYVNGREFNCGGSNTWAGDIAAFQGRSATGNDYDCDGFPDDEDPNPGKADQKDDANKGPPGCNGSTGKWR